MDPPQFLYYNFRKALFVFHIGVGWQHPFLGTLLPVETMCLGWSWWFSPCPVELLGPSLHGPTLIPLLQFWIGYICVPHWCWVVAPITWNFIGCENPVSGPIMMVFTLSCCATWPFSPWTHLNFSVTFSDRLYYIPLLGMEKGGVTLSVLHSTSVSQTNRNLQHECCRIFMIHCILVTRMSHQWKSAS
jgi:hypothetical protein